MYSGLNMDWDPREIVDLEVPAYGATFRCSRTRKMFKMERGLRGPMTCYECMAEAWAFAHIRSIAGGLLLAQHGGHQVRINDGSAVFLPPFSIVKWLVRADFVKFETLFSYTALPNDLGALPALAFPWTSADLPCDSDTVFDILRDAKQSFYRVDRNPKPLPLAFRAKRLISATFAEPATMAEIARKLRTSNSVIDRAFKKSYGLTPVAYRSSLRVNESHMSLLLSGATVNAVARRVGFNDFSRYYRNFKSEKKVTPSQFLI